MKKLIFLILLFSSVVNSQRTVTQWVSSYETKYQAQKTNETNWSTGLDSGYYYFLSYYIVPHTKIWQVTGDPIYLERALILCERMISNALPSNTLTGSTYSDSYLGWLDDYQYTPANEGALSEQHGWRAVTHLLMVMKANGFDVNPTYSTRYNDILDFTEINIWDKWVARNQVWRTVRHISSHNASMAMDLYYITGTQKYKDFTDIFFNGSNPIRSGNATSSHVYGTTSGLPTYTFNMYYSTSDAPGGNATSDTFHAADLIDTFIKAYKLNMYGIDDTFLEITKNTFLTNVWNGSLNGTKAYYFVDGTGGFDVVGSSTINRLYYWFELGEYEPEVLQAQEDYYLSDVGYNFFTQAVGAYNRASINNALVYPDPNLRQTTPISTAEKNQNKIFWRY